MKSTTMIIPTPSKIEINGQRIFLEVVKVDDEDSEVVKIPKVYSGREIVEIGRKKMK